MEEEQKEQTIELEEIDKNKYNSDIDELESKLKALRKERYKTLDLVKTETEGVKIGIRRNGRKYSVRDHRDKFFYPFEWMKFFDALNKKQKFTFRFLIIVAPSFVCSARP